MEIKNWAVRDGTYTKFTGGQTSKDIPPGYYSTSCGMFGEAIFSAVDLKTDNLQLSPNSQSADIMDELKLFWGKAADFKKYDLLFKRGILLYGPPGTGKTSLMNIVIKESKDRGAICLRMDAPHIMQICLAELRSVHNDMPILVIIEDIDRWAHDSDLLDLLDGSAQVENVTYLATTNYLSKLPPRIAKRPSRFDKCIEIGFPAMDVRKHYFDGLFKEDGKDVTELVEKSKGFTFAHMKELFIATVILGSGIDETVERLRDTEILEAEDDDDEDEEYGLTSSYR
jgi:SpoVK/Ycf46/Vps4 family AAA+-type ATPase